MTQKPNELSTLNIEALAEIYGDNSAETITMAITGFEESARLYMGLLQQAYSKHDTQALAAAAHSLRSICGLTGVEHLAALSKQLEEAAKEGNSTQLGHLMPVVTAHWPQVLTALQQALAEHGACSG